MLPRGFVQMRHYGLLANRGREEKLALCRRLLAARVPTAVRSAVQPAETDDPHAVAACGVGVMVVVELLPRQFGEVVDVQEEVDSS